MVMQMKLLLWIVCFQEQQPAVLLLTAVVLSRVFRTKCLCVYLAYSQLWLHSNIVEWLKKRSYCHACGLLVEAVKLYLYCCLSLPGCTMDRIYARACTHQALWAACSRFALIKPWWLNKSYMQESNKFIFQAMKAAANLTPILDNVCVHCLFRQPIQMVFMVAYTWS